MPITDDPALSRLDPDSNAFDEIPGRTSSVQTQGFLKTWFASSADLRSTADTNDVEWGIHWVTPASVILLFVLGTMSAIGHHLHYKALHDTIVGTETEQRWASWIGSGFSFFTKVTLTAALGISRTQWVWWTLRKKWLTLRGIDAVFGVTSDPTYFMNALMLKRAKAATIIAVSMWMIPIAAILTPGTISVDQFPETKVIPCSVGSLRFPFDDNSTAILQAKSDIAPILPVVGLAEWSTVTNRGSTMEVSHQVMRTLRLSAYTGSIGRAMSLPDADSPSATTLSQKCGANCSYTIEFLGPSVNCTRFTSWSTVSWNNVSMFMLGRSYYSDKGPRNEILIGISSPAEPMRPTVFLCRASTARYTVEYVIVERSLVEPKITKVESVVLAVYKASGKYGGIMREAGQIALMDALHRVLLGSIQNRTETTTDVQLTPLAETIIRNPTAIGTAVEQMGHKMVVSLIGSDLLVDGSAYILDVAATQDTMCTTTTYNLLYVYSARTLILVYALAVACALVTTVAGFFALRQNGMASTQTPSSMIRTSRNPTLDEAIVGNYTLGGNTMSDELEKMELRFGALSADAKGTVHYALGVRGEISPIKRD